MLTLLLAFSTAFAVTYFAIPSIIHIARTKRLYDEPEARSSHRERTPSLGGISIFAGTIFSIIYWTPFEDFNNLQYIFCALLIVFLIGAKDDISPVSPGKKVIAQIMAAAILVLKSGVVLNSMYGLLGFHANLPPWLGGVLTIFTLMVITNAINLIDGIDGLAGSVVALAAATFGCWFYVADHLEFATIAFATVGAVLAFLKYNFSPAQIFMGDTGSLILGLITALLAIKFIDCNHALGAGHPYRLEGGVAVAIGILIIPIFDTLRVFITRILRGQSPMQADRRHIHHLLIDYGCSHMQATAILVGANMFYISLVFMLHDRLNLHYLLLLMLTTILAMTYWVHEQVKKRNQQAQQN
ncbi:MAG: undecaprenyl/decaprenyl-phosphate alpha-N-acetylglucosaminyl 1-phosphate transferase [Bacteroidetes bacterium]|nr:MAG: undecaprenyl/decaprenyl-phosphate alpha-N-acetylglucosaminyl 1-phosphate transferase [Bacteroidota bacterium]